MEWALIARGMRFGVNRLGQRALAFRDFLEGRLIRRVEDDLSSPDNVWERVEARRAELRRRRRVYGPPRTRSSV